MSADLGVYLVPVIVADAPEACRVAWKPSNQEFNIGPDYWETKEEAEWFARLFRQALTNFRRGHD